MIKCASCGTDNRDTARFCNRCGSTLPVASQGQGRLAAGTVVRGRYRVVSILGQGGMGAVYLAEDQRLFGKKRWALKEFVDTFLNPADRANAIKLFEQEARLLGSLSHANLPHVADFFVEGGRQYLVMEYIEGDTLATLLHGSQGGLAETDVVTWAEQLCNVLEYLHGQTPNPVIFRDLKPANIMVTRSGNTIKLIDFGIARLFDVAKQTDTLKMGTVGYAPPEQYAGRGQTDPRSDIYALGATLHHLLTQRDPSTQPFIFPPCRTLNARVSPLMEAVVSRAVDHDPARRFQTAAEMRQALPGKQAASPILSPTTPSSAAAPTVPGAATPAMLDVKGPEDVKWTGMSLSQTFTAYCGKDGRDTQWVIEGNGARSCLECGRHVGMTGSGSHMQAWCSRCGRPTTRAWSGDQCACLGCGRIDKVGGFKQQMLAWCRQCGRQTAWAGSEREVACLGCGVTHTVADVKVLNSEDRTELARRRWTITTGMAGFCSKCGCKTPWLTLHITYYRKGYGMDRQIVRKCLWCGDER